MIETFQNIIEIKNGLSNKKIFRIFEKNLSKIIIDFSRDKKEFDNFLTVTNILKNVNISIPKIYEVHFKRKIIVMEDFGDNSFSNIYDEKDLYNLLKLAVDNLITIQNRINYDEIKILRKYNFHELKKEITEFTDYYIPYKKITNFSLQNFFQTWERVYNDQQFNFNSFVHKDFELINLIFLKNRKLHLKCGIIDYQSAFLGFAGWDLFCILENPRINFRRNYNEDLIRYFYENTYQIEDLETFRNQYYLLNLGRQTRLLGRWVKLLNNGKKDYINYLQPTKNRITSTLTYIKDNELRNIYEQIFKINV